MCHYIMGFAFCPMSCGLQPPQLDDVQNPNYSLISTWCFSHRNSFICYFFANYKPHIFHLIQNIVLWVIQAFILRPFQASPELVAEQVTAARAILSLKENDNTKFSSWTVVMTVESSCGGQNRFFFCSRLWCMFIVSVFKVGHVNMEVGGDWLTFWS